MKILFLNQFFWPDSSATSQLLTDLARGMVERGHEVTVICSDSGYAPAAGDQAPPMRIERAKTLPFVRGGMGRMLSYLSFYVRALMIAFTLPKADVVVSLTTPPLISLVGSLVKALRGSRHVIWEMDVYPDVAVDLNYFTPGGVIHRVTGALADLSRRHADGLLALGECMKQRLIARGIEPGRIRIAENWADGDAIRPTAHKSDPSKLVLLYSGNLGLAHDVGTVMGAMRALREDDRFRFVFVGGGARRAELAAFCSAEAIGSVQMLPYAARENLGESLSRGDIGLVTQQDVCCGSVVPSKIYGILAAGRPILFIGPRNSTVSLTIARFGCGWQIDCGDVESLTGLLLSLAEDAGAIAVAGQRAREALLAAFDLPIGVQRIAVILESIHPFKEQVQQSSPTSFNDNDRAVPTDRPSLSARG